MSALIQVVNGVSIILTVRSKSHNKKLKHRSGAKSAPPLDSQPAGFFVHSLRSLSHKNPISLSAA